MARRKREFDPEVSADIYTAKVVSVWRGISGTTDLAEKITKALASRMVTKSSVWSKVRKTVSAICSERGIPKSNHAIYMSAVQLYLKDVTDRGIDPNTSIRMITHMYPNIDIGVIEDCVRAITGEELFIEVPLPKKKEGGVVSATAPSKV